MSTNKDVCPMLQPIQNGQHRSVARCRTRRTRRTPSNRVHKHFIANFYKCYTIFVQKLSFKLSIRY